jgi:regulation of enolase protein 1 (concanavalin A-like superfamily)
LAPKVPIRGPVHKQLHPCSRIIAVLLVSLSTIAVSDQRADAAGVGAWTLADVGSPALRGAASEATCSPSTGCPLFSVSGAGLGMVGTTDQFAFLYQKLTGDGVVTARLLALTGAATVEAGLMVRESLAAGSRHASLLTAASGTSFRSRAAVGGNMVSKPVPRGSWLRLERVGPALTASVSSDGSQWTIVATQTLTMPATIYAGIVVTSRVSATLATASVSNMSLSSTTPTLPSGWTSADVGNAPSAGTASYTNGSFIGASAGAGFASTGDAFRFIYRRVRGDAKLSARLVMSEGRTGRLSGIVLRTTLDPGSAETALLADETGLVFVTRAAGGQTLSKARLATTATPVFLQLNRTGSMLSVAYSTDGTTWKTVANVSVAFGSDLYAGLGIAAGPNGGLAAAAFDRLSLVSVAANVPPAVSLVTPSTGRVVVEGASVAMTASASDPDDLVASVDFRVNGVKVASDTVAPYAATWIAGTPGVYSIAAAAADFDGAVTTSSPALITVAPKIGLPPPDDSGSGSIPTLPPGPLRLQFTPSADHAKITNYTMEIAIVGSLLLKVSKNIGKPPIGADGTCIVDIDGILSLLPAGSYQVVVKAVASTGVSPSLGYSFSK